MIAERMNAALNAHDTDSVVALFAPDWDSVQPARCSPACPTSAPS